MTLYLFEEKMSSLIANTATFRGKAFVLCGTCSFSGEM